MPPGESLREQVRRRLAAKELFLISRRGRAEPASGNACAVCALATPAGFSTPCGGRRAASWRTSRATSSGDRSRRRRGCAGRAEGRPVISTDSLLLR